MASNGDPGSTSLFGWPLSPWPWPTLAPGRLDQAINPGWSFGNLVNVNYVNSSAPTIERDVLAQHSYGRQIGRLMDAVCALAERLPAAARGDARIVDFEALAKDVARIKRDARLPRLARLREDIAALERDDPKAYQELRAGLRG